MEHSSEIQEAGPSKARLKQLVIGAVVFGMALVALTSLFIPTEPVATAIIPAATREAKTKPNRERPATPSVDAKWYTGGKLHEATGEQWIAAAPANQLATSADWALRAPNVQAKVQQSGTMDTLRPYADALRDCVSNATTAEMAKRNKVTDVAVACVLASGW